MTLWSQPGQDSSRRLFPFRPHHFGVSVPDLQTAIDCYREFIGFERESRLAIDAIAAQVAFVNRDGFRIEIFEVSGVSDLPPKHRLPDLDLPTHGDKHMCFEVRSVPELVAALRKNGADVALELEVDGNPTAFIRDIAGNLIEFVEPFCIMQNGPLL